MTLTSEQKSAVRTLTKGTISSLLQLLVTYRLTNHLIQRHRTEWRELEASLHYNDYPIRGAGVIATPDNIEKIDPEKGGFLHMEELVAPEDIVSQVGDFPLNAATASYAFTLMEVCGDEVLKHVNPSYFKPRQAWHRDVYRGQKPKELVIAFNKPFLGNFQDVKTENTHRLMALKEARNLFAHQGEADITLTYSFRLLSP